MDNNKILIIGIIFLIFIIIKFNMIENFTQDEYNNYSFLLKENCYRNREILNKIKKLNSYRCNKKGNTTRETINNNTLCYDDIGKEIVSNLDTISYCNMAEYKPSKDESNNESTNKSKNKSKDVSLIKSNIFEDPSNEQDIINKFYLDSYTSTKVDNDYMINNSEDRLLHNYPVSTSYSNISFSSDPAFLSRLNNKK